MKFVLLFLLAMFAGLTQAFARPYSQYVDIGFRGADKYIAIELTGSEGGDTLRFSLSSVTNPGKTVAISPCAYDQRTLEAEVRNIADPKVKADFAWIFFRSNHSASPIEQFYPELKLLLERSNPKCPVQDLQKLKDQLHSQRG